ncbi:hypothetical protein KKA13_02720 [Patescibacteria group bacterium]|nr:hypothetical protein [Patescibacteria group bacterium]
MSRFINYRTFFGLSLLILPFLLLTPKALAATQTQTCNDATLNIVFRDVGGNYIPSLKYEIYKKITNADGYTTAGQKITGGTIDQNGRGKVVLRPGTYTKDKNGYENYKSNSPDGYVMKVYEKNPNVGEFWFYDGWQPYCGQTMEITKQITALLVTLRDAQGNLLKNHAFSLFQQETDADVQPAKINREAVGQFTTGETGMTKIYLSYDHPWNRTKKGIYAFTSKSAMGFEYTAYGIRIPYGLNGALDYTFGNVLFELRNGANEPIKNNSIEVYLQTKDLKGRKILGKKLYSKTTDEKGELRLDHPSATVVAVVKDNAGKAIQFFDIKIPDRKLLAKQLKTNLVRVTANQDSTMSMPAGTNIKVKSLLVDAQKNYHPDKVVASLSLANNDQADFVLVPGDYIFSFTKDGKEYGRAFRVENKYYQIVLEANSNYIINKDTKFTRSNFELEKFLANKPAKLTNKFAGKIVTLDDKKTNMWYVDVNLGEKYLLKDAATALKIFKRLGLYVTETDLYKLPFAVTNTAKLADTDGDWLTDELENFFHTDINSRDTDNDTHADGKEIYFGYNPKGSGAIAKDDKLANDLKGQILIIGDATSSIWYVNPTNGRAYYVTQGKNIMMTLKFVAVKVAKKDLDAIKVGSAKY